MKFKLLITIFLFTLPNCGYKIVNQNYLDEYKFIDTNISGDKRVVYLLKNKLNTANETVSKSIKLNLITEKNKQISEKNIQNEITKYKINISAKVNFYVVESNKNGVFTISKSGIYRVSDRYTQTLSNERKLIKNLVNDISNQIRRDLMMRLDDL